MNQLTNIGTNALSGFVEDLTLVRIPPWWQNPWLVLLLLAALALLVVGSFRLYVRFHRADGVSLAPNPAPQEPPHLWALRQLEELKLKVAELGAYPYTIACSHVLRRYIEAQFKLPILYQTTREFLGYAQTHTALREAERSRLGEYLRLCDLVKFARRDASAEEKGQMVDYAIRFVQTSAGLEPSPVTAAEPTAAKV